MPKTLTFKAIRAKQSDRHEVFSFAASAKDVFEIARIDRAGRNTQGELFGFQRPQVSQHIHEIRDYLKKDDAVLPNSVVLAFVGGVKTKHLEDGLSEIQVEVGDEAPGLVVDGQQRLTALQALADKDFQVFVSAMICKDDEDLRRQFILINNTRPLPKELIYELLPTVTDLPHRMASRSFAANLTTLLNYAPGEEGASSALQGQIKQHTNPSGSISSNAIQRVIMNSRSNGALRDFARDEDAAQKSLKMIGDFYGAVMDLFPEAWIGMGPRNSRLKHSVGIIALGYAMEMAYALHGARTREDFRDKLKCLTMDGLCAWTSGTWVFNREESRNWDRLQNTPPDIRLLSDYLVRLVRDQGVRSGSDLDQLRASLNEQLSLVN
ncbi:DGQHR domain-containing protein DpdB [Ruegeria sp. HKCCSP335]|uniref:DGQHR domain-containing protein DpdB n=1 Tax=Ruegeria sp. HKCCSP335 TaxID=2794833 RepID=UPI001AE539C9|nr:DGQHR domain-containing protein DpdB [Ruegeria sp. HKCCSP335]